MNENIKCQACNSDDLKYDKQYKNPETAYHYHFRIIITCNNCNNTMKSKWINDNLYEKEIKGDF